MKKTFAVTVFPATMMVTAGVLVGGVSSLPTVRNEDEHAVYLAGNVQYTPLNPVSGSLSMKAIVTTAGPGLDTTMTVIRNTDRPWSRRLLKLDADQRVTPNDLAKLVAVLTLSDAERWPTPGVFPGEDGGLRIEWGQNGSRTIYEIDDEGDAYAFSFDFVAGVDDAAEPADFNAAASFLRSHLNA